MKSLTIPQIETLVLNKAKLNLGVSDHHRASFEQIFFFKHQCALMEHNIVMKQIGSIVVILNHSEFFSLGHFYILWLFVAFSCLKTLFLDFHQ